MEEALRASQGVNAALGAPGVEPIRPGAPGGALLQQYEESLRVSQEIHAVLGGPARAGAPGAVLMYRAEESLRAARGVHAALGTPGLAPAREGAPGLAGICAAAALHGPACAARALPGEGHLLVWGAPGEPLRVMRSGVDADGLAPPCAEGVALRHGRERVPVVWGEYPRAAALPDAESSGKLQGAPEAPEAPGAGELRAFWGAYAAEGGRPPAEGAPAAEAGAPAVLGEVAAVEYWCRAEDAPRAGEAARGLGLGSWGGDGGCGWAAAYAGACALGRAVGWGAAALWLPGEGGVALLSSEGGAPAGLRLWAEYPPPGRVRVPRAGGSGGEGLPVYAGGGGVAPGEVLAVRGVGPRPAEEAL